MSNPGGHEEVVPTIGRSGEDAPEHDDEQQKDDYEEEPFHRRRRQAREVRAIGAGRASIQRPATRLIAWPRNP